MSLKRSADNTSWDPNGLAKKLKAAKNTDLDEFLVIGIDFGTTYSGVAWATAADFSDEHINIITTWPGSRLEEGKVPTKLFYEDGELHSWGFDVPTDAIPLSWFKLLLLQNEDLPSKLRKCGPLLRARRELEKLGKTPVEVIADYLRELWEYSLKVITMARSAAVLEAFRLHVVLTVPASWRDYARYAMKEAAERAGIASDRAAGETVISFAIEPEAAAFATIWEKERHLKVDDVYMICDAGGGTVDIITYRVGKVNPLELHEAVGGEAGICGGIFIDEAFRRACQDRLGRRWQNLSQKGITDIMQTEWEYAIKTTFTPNTKKREHIVGIPAEAFKRGRADMNDTSREPHIKAGRIHFTPSDIQKTFDESFADITGLVARQISKSTSSPVTAIILVGGLGSSPYLYDYLSNIYQGKLEIMQARGARPRTAICRGAIYKGFMDRLSDCSGGLDSQVPMQVASTIARYSLGVGMNTEFIPGVHLEKDKFWNTEEGKWFAKNQVQWYLKRGDIVATRKGIRYDFYQILNSTKLKHGLQTSVMRCELSSPPNRVGNMVKELGTFHFETKHLDIDDLEIFESADGRKRSRISYEIEMVPSGASTVFTCHFQGKKLGSHEFRLDLT